MLEADSVAAVAVVIGGRGRGETEQLYALASYCRFVEEGPSTREEHRHGCSLSLLATVRSLLGGGGWWPTVHIFR